MDAPVPAAVAGGADAVAAAVDMSAMVPVAVAVVVDVKTSQQVLEPSVQ